MIKRNKNKKINSNENAEMVLNNNKQIKHHTDELPNAIKGKNVPAWVVAKVNRSASDLSDVTHYMDGQGDKFETGGALNNDMCIQKVVDMISRMKDVDDYYIVDRKLVIILKEELRLYDLDILNYHLSEIEGCSNVIDNEFEIGYGEEYKTLILSLKTDDFTKHKFKKGGDTSDLSDATRGAYAYVKLESGGMLSNKLKMINIEFDDQTDRRHGMYSFSFETIDNEGASVLDYSGYIIERPIEDRRDDEIEWDNNVPEDWEKAEDILINAFYNWKRNKYANGGEVSVWETIDGEIVKEISKFNGIESILLYSGHFVEVKDSKIIGSDYLKVPNYVVDKINKDLNRNIKYDEGKYAKGGGVGEDKLELFYVMDNNGNVKNISKSYEKANEFLEKSLKFNGNIGYKNVPKSDWYAEKINVSNIKNYAKGGGVDSEIRGGIRYVKGKDLEWREIMSFDIADYGEEEAEKMAYKFVQQYIKYWNGELNENDFLVKKSRNGKDFKGSWVVMRQIPKYAKGGEIEINDSNSLRYFLLNHASSGMIANKIPYSDYKTIDAIRLTALQILNRDGDREYSVKSFSDLIQEALLEYEENKYEGKFAKGGGVSSFISKAKSVSQKALSKTKEAYGKTKQYAKDKIHDTKKKNALDVLAELGMRANVSRKEEENIVNPAYDLVYDKYAKGGGVGKEEFVKFGDLAIGNIYFQVTRPNLGIEKIEITKKENGTYTYKSDNNSDETYVTKYSGRYTDNEKLYGIFSDKDEAKQMAINLLTEQMSKYAEGGGVGKIKVGSKIGFLRPKTGRYEWAEVLSIDGENVNLVVRHPKRRQWDNYFTETKSRITEFINTESDDWKDGRPLMKIKYAEGGGVGKIRSDRNENNTIFSINAEFDETKNFNVQLYIKSLKIEPDKVKIIDKYGMLYINNLDALEASILAQKLENNKNFFNINIENS